MIWHCLSRRPARVAVEPSGLRPAWLALLLTLLLAPGAASAATQISAVSLKRVEDRTRIVLETKTEVRFSLIVLQNPERVMLELEGVELNAVLAGLAGLVAADHPTMKPIRISPAPGGVEAVRLEFGLKGEAQPGIYTLKPAAGHGYRLVLDIVSPAAAPAASESAAPESAAPASSALVAPVAPKAAAAVELEAPRPPASGATGPAPLWREDPNLILLEVRLDKYVLSDAITTFQDGQETFLPLGELARLLTLAIAVRPDQGVAEGFVLSAARRFALDLAQARITLGDQTQVFDPALVRSYSDDMYVASTLLARWLPIDFEVDLSRLALRVLPRERLPLQERLERENLGARLGTRAGYEDPGYPRLDMPYRLLGVPSIDQTLGAGLSSGRGSRQTDVNYTAYLTGALLGVESALFIKSTKDEPRPELRFTLARHDPEAGLLGPLHASSVIFGNGVGLPSVANVVSHSQLGNGYGMTLSNRPATQPTSFDRHTLQGDLPPGWDVELYFNDALVGFQAARADGRYSFDDQPLVYGLNEFRLVFHSPLGQQRVETQRFLLEQSSTPPGAFYYGLTRHQDKTGLSRSVANFEWGLSKSLTATGGLTRAPVPLGASPATLAGLNTITLAGLNTTTLAGLNTTTLGGLSTTTLAGLNTATLGGVNTDGGRLYSNLGLRAFWHSFIISNDFFRAQNGGWLNESGFKTRLGGVALNYSHTQLNDFTSEVYVPSGDPLRMRDKVRLDGALATGFLPPLRLTMEAQREQFQSGGSNLSVTGRVAAYVNRTAMSNQLTGQISGGNSSATGLFQLSRRFGDIGLSGQISYFVKPRAMLETVALTGDKRLGEAYLLNLGLVRSVGGRETLYLANLNKNMGNFGLGLNTSYSSNRMITVGLQLSTAMSREPRQAKWHFDAQPKADSGAASVRVFLDNNGNGVMDEGDEPIENAAININGNRAPVRTDASGVAWLDRLPIRQNVDIAVDAQTLEDPYWAPQQKGWRMVPRPGHTAQLDFPVILTSEIDGTVYLGEKTARNGMGDVAIELLDADGKLVSTTKTSSDGYYIVAGVPQGSYQLQVSPQQRKQFGLIDPGTRAITILPDGKFVNGVDFVLRKIPLGSVSVPGPSR